jgi:hypothetical protein
MASQKRLNTRSSATKRILQEVKELQSDLGDFVALPLEVSGVVPRGRGHRVVCVEEWCLILMGVWFVWFLGGSIRVARYDERFTWN